MTERWAGGCGDLIVLKINSCMKTTFCCTLNAIIRGRGEWGKLSHSPYLNQKNRRKEIPFTPCCTKIHLVVGKFQGKKKKNISHF